MAILLRLLKFTRGWPKQFCLPIAVLLAQKKRPKLALWYLGGFYARLDKCIRNVILSFRRYDVVIYVDVNFLQLFLWERFKVLSPKPNEFGTVHPQWIDGVERVQTSLLKYLGQRWFGNN